MDQEYRASALRGVKFRGLTSRRRARCSGLRTGPCRRCPQHVPAHRRVRTQPAQRRPPQTTRFVPRRRRHQPRSPHRESATLHPAHYQLTQQHTNTSQHASSERGCAISAFLKGRGRVKVLVLVVSARDRAASARGRGLVGGAWGVVCYAPGFRRSWIGQTRLPGIPSLTTSAAWCVPATTLRTQADRRPRLEWGSCRFRARAESCPSGFTRSWPGNGSRRPVGRSRRA